jgi:hypothetical protein
MLRWDPSDKRTDLELSWSGPLVSSDGMRTEDKETREEDLLKILMGRSKR